MNPHIRFLLALAVAVLAVLGIAFGGAIVKGYHFGSCSVWTGGRETTVLGVAMCRVGTSGSVAKPHEQAVQQQQQAAQLATREEEEARAYKQHLEAYDRTEEAERHTEEADAPREARRAEKEEQCSEGGGPGC
jgi:hypothetical protein